ncbi:hypothetical protein BH11BAC1_BH11BAC1_18600 [soil metagenome]
MISGLLKFNSEEMGVSIAGMNSYFEYSNGHEIPEQQRQVLALAEKSLLPLIRSGLPRNLTHLVIATSCPDMIAPSLGQMIGEKFNDSFSDCHIIDLVQGCAGGVSAMILASQLSELNKSSILVIQADAAKKATSRSKKINKVFGNGSFTCIVNHDQSGKAMLHFKSRQYKGLSEVVTIKLGHDADKIIMKEKSDMSTDPRLHLGLSLNNSLALKLFMNAEKFYLDFIQESSTPDIMILHQVNPLIVKHLQKIFAKYKLQFIDVAALTGNCGVASVGIALESIKEKIEGKKILLCSFGTGGVITAGLWQN